MKKIFNKIKNVFLKLIGLESVDKYRDIKNTVNKVLKTKRNLGKGRFIFKYKNNNIKLIKSTKNKKWKVHYSIGSSKYIFINYSDSIRKGVMKAMDALIDL